MKVPKLRWVFIGLVCSLVAISIPVFAQDSTTDTPAEAEAVEEQLSDTPAEVEAAGDDASVEQPANETVADDAKPPTSPQNADTVEAAETPPLQDVQTGDALDATADTDIETMADEVLPIPGQSDQTGDGLDASADTDIGTDTVEEDGLTIPGQTDQTGDALDASTDINMPQIPPIQLPATGIGGSIALFSYFIGFSAFYDFRLFPNTAIDLHSLFTYDIASTDGDGANMNLNRIFLSTYYRFPFQDIEGLRVGVGGGYGQISLTYNNSATGHSYAAAGSGLFASGEISWRKHLKWMQGKQILFNAGFNLGFFLLYSDDFDESQISGQTNHREIVNTGWSAAKQIIHIQIGMGMKY